MIIDINARVMYKIFAYAQYAKLHFKSEIAGWGHYSDDDGIYKLAPLQRQIVSGAEVDTFPEEILNSDYDMSDMIVQWHSHVDMGVTASGTDIALIEKAIKIFPAIISIIVNCRGEYSARIDIAKGGRFSFGTITEKVTLCPYYNEDKISKDVLNKCSKPAPPPIPATPIVNNHYSWRNPAYFNGDDAFDFDLKPVEPQKHISATEYLESQQPKNIITADSKSPGQEEIYDAVKKIADLSPYIKVNLYNTPKIAFGITSVNGIYYYVSNGIITRSGKQISYEELIKSLL